MALAAPVAVLDKTNREPAEVVRMLAVTPGLLVDPLIAAAIPASVLLVESMTIEALDPPTAMFKVPVPIVAPELATGWERQAFGCREVFVRSRHRSPA